MNEHGCFEITELSFEVTEGMMEPIPLVCPFTKSGPSCRLNVGHAGSILMIHVGWYFIRTTKEGEKSLSGELFLRKILQRGKGQKVWILQNSKLRQKLFKFIASYAMTFSPEVQLFCSFFTIFEKGCHAEEVHP